MNEITSFELIHNQKFKYDVIPPSHTECNFVQWSPEVYGTRITVDTDVKTVYQIKRFVVKFIVKELDGKETIKSQQNIIYGHDATPPVVESKSLYNFLWDDDYTKITQDKSVYGSYYLKAGIYRVNFYDKSKNKIGNTQLIVGGEDATPPTPPQVEGYKFLKWEPDYKNIVKDTEIYSTYVEYTPKLQITYYSADDKKNQTIKTGYINASDIGETLSLSDDGKKLNDKFSAIGTDSKIISINDLSETVLHIGDYCFCGPHNTSKINKSKIAETLEEIILPAATTIGKYSFYECANLKNVKTGALTGELGEKTFSGCDNLTSLDLGNITKITQNGLNDCKNLTSIKMDNVTEIQEKGLNKVNLEKIIAPKLKTTVTNSFTLNSTKLSQISVPEIENFGSINSVKVQSSITELYLPKLKSCDKKGLSIFKNYLIKISLPKNMKDTFLADSNFKKSLWGASKTKLDDSGTTGKNGKNLQITINWV